MPAFKGSIHDNHGSMVRFANIETRNVATRLTCLPMVSTQVQSFAHLVRLMSKGFCLRNRTTLKRRDTYLLSRSHVMDIFLRSIVKQTVTVPTGANGGTAVSQAFMTQREQTVVPSKNACVLIVVCSLRTTTWNRKASPGVVYMQIADLILSLWGSTALVQYNYSGLGH